MWMAARNRAVFLSPALPERTAAGFPDRLSGMTAAFTLKALVGLLPVLAFLGFLLYLDSYKLLRLKTIVIVIAAGGAAARPTRRKARDRKSVV